MEDAEAGAVEEAVVVEVVVSKLEGSHLLYLVFAELILIFVNILLQLQHAVRAFFWAGNAQVSIDCWMQRVLSLSLQGVGLKSA